MTATKRATRDRLGIPFVRATRYGLEVRIPVPTAAAVALGKKNLTRRLGTRSRAEAKALAPAIVAEFQARIEAALSAKTETPFVPVAALAAIEKWRDGMRQELLPAAFSEGPPGACPLGLEWRKVWHRHDDLYFGAEVIVDPQDQLLRKILGDRAPPPSNTPAWEKLRHALSTACRALRTEVEAVRGGDRRPLTTLNAQQTTTTQVAGDGPTMSTVFLGYRERHVSGGGSHKTCAEFETQLRRFVALHGDLSVKSVTRQHCREFRDVMREFPSRVAASSARRNPQEIVANARRNGPYQRLSPKTLNDKVFASVHAVLGFAVDEGIIDQNPMARIRVPAPDIGPAKLPYSADDLRRLFSSPVLSGSENPTTGGQGLAAQWVPLLALYTGARLEEIAQLAVSDVKEQAGMVFIHIRAAYGHEDASVEFQRRLKTASSRRKVPIHSTLLSLGFLDYKRRLLARNETHLFPHMLWTEDKKRRPDLKVSRAWGRWYQRYSRRFVPDANKGFGSFRHTVKSRLRNANVDKVLRDALMGHAADDVAERYGLDEEGSGFDLVTLKDAIEKLTYEGLELVAPRPTN